jgi:hypothetical protein
MSEARRLMPDELVRARLLFTSDEASACTNQQDYVVDAGRT